jgi:hypothetical protein
MRATRRNSRRRWLKRLLIALLLSYPTTIATALWELLRHRRLPRETGPQKLIHLLRRRLERIADLEREILTTVCDDDETTRLILEDLHNRNNAEHFSDEAKRLDFDALDAVFKSLEAQGLVTSRPESTDGREHPRPRVTYTWWRITDAGRRVCAIDDANPDP